LRREPLFQRQGGHAERSQPPTRKEILMRILALVVLAIGAAAAAAPAQAQTYDPSYPVCLHVYGKVSYYECAYNTLPQCNATAADIRSACMSTARSAIMSAAIRRFLNATRRPRAARRNASSIHILQMRIRIGRCAGAAFTERLS